jgi:hypothetical protein
MDFQPNFAAFYRKMHCPVKLSPPHAQTLSSMRNLATMMQDTGNAFSLLIGFFDGSTYTQLAV